METTIANRWATDIARYLNAHQPKRAMALRARIKHLVHGHELDDNDLAQLERKVRRIIFGAARNERPFPRPGAVRGLPSQTGR